MTEQQLREPPERDTSVPRTAEESARRRALVWLIVKLVLVVIAVWLVLTGISACFSFLTSAGSTGALGALPALGGVVG
ncbi:hypothetical protein ACT3TZ_13045 [Brachybacterium sp. AOP25-B2-12]|uniref:hypothetical protein n=1 Tax=Brachybacterium sp. AOP25-B2-12 TaxID=3457710 RepID=UPI004034E20C